MSNDRPDDDRDLERLLSEAFDAKAHANFPNRQQPAPMRLPDHLSPHRHRHHRGASRWLAPLAAAAAVIVVVAIVVGLSGSSSNKPNAGALGSPTITESHSASSGQSSSAASQASSSAPATGKPVHVSSAVLSDGSQVGVGMPIILLISKPLKDARPFAAATRVTVNGKPVNGGWYFERKYGDKGNPIEADYRLPAYWPAHAQIHMSLNVKGKSAGTGLVFDNNLSLDFATGAANVLTVDDSTNQLTVTSDGQQWPDSGTTFPVSLGATATPTRRGTKVIMEKGNSICMHGPGYNECGVRYTQRLTYDGEYLHAAPWNTANIARGINSSNGCTNLTTGDAKKLYGFLEIGDVVKYPNADGSLMQIGDGYGDWNVPWPQWQTGGLYPVS
jgi:lipoprotein-anchoring transpeptidase ErfK/SrfK